MKLPTPDPKSPFYPYLVSSSLTRARVYASGYLGRQSQKTLLRLDEEKDLELYAPALAAMNSCGLEFCTRSPEIYDLLASLGHTFMVGGIVECALDMKHVRAVAFRTKSLAEAVEVPNKLNVGMSAFIEIELPPPDEFASFLLSRVDNGMKRLLSKFVNEGDFDLLRSRTFITMALTCAFKAPCKILSSLLSRNCPDDQLNSASTRDTREGSLRSLICPKNARDPIVMHEVMHLVVQRVHRKALYTPKDHGIACAVLDERMPMTHRSTDLRVDLLEAWTLNMDPDAIEYLPLRLGGTPPELEDAYAVADTYLCCVYMELERAGREIKLLDRSRGRVVLFSPERGSLCT